MLAARALRDEAAGARRECQAALQRADFLEQQAAAAPSSQQVAALEGAIKLDDRATLQRFLTSLGPGWEASLQELGATARAAVTVARVGLAEASKQLDVASWQHEEAARRRDEAEARAKKLEAELGTLDAAQLDRSLAEASRQHDEAVRALAALSEG